MLFQQPTSINYCQIKRPKRDNKGVLQTCSWETLVKRSKRTKKGQ